MSRLIKSSAFLVAFAFAAPGVMAEKPAAPQTVVFYGDLNLESRDGMNTLFKRIDRASKKVCGKQPSTVLNSMLTRYRACRDAASGDAVRSMSNPSVSIAWAGRTSATIQIASR
jgi:UrcA family protein